MMYLFHLNCVLVTFLDFKGLFGGLRQKYVGFQGYF